VKLARLLVAALLCSATACAQQIEKPEPTGAVRNELLSRPAAFAQEIVSSAHDLVTFRDPSWSLLTIAQIGAASADAVTSLNNFHACPTCTETGVSRFFVGQRPDMHKYLIGGAIEIAVEAVTEHYLLHHGPTHKWYWRTLWTMPQSISLYEHAQASRHNASLIFACLPQAPHCG
jgi:hypothetical protein